MKLGLAVLGAVLYSSLALGQGVVSKLPSVNYVNNRAPLKQSPYVALPLGAISPQGWLREMLVRQKNGSTGQLDKLYPLVMNQRNGWLGGDGDQWERGPYWIDGLLPLAYILKDQQLIAKVKPWIEWTLKSQQPDGYFGPAKDYGPEEGIQRDNSHDWWPKMVMLKVLQQYYSATQDQRVIQLMSNYFKYQLKELPTHPLDHWTFWARYRGGDNLMMVYWLYNITGDSSLLKLADLIHSQVFDYTNSFLNTNMLATIGSIHCVNLAQGIKEPIIYYQQHPEQKYLNAVNKGFADLQKHDGTAQGMYGGDEALHGNNPTQGSELCSAVEMMYSLESILPITGNVSYADHLEKVAFNALPTQITPDFMRRQYFQQANQVLMSRQVRNFDSDHEGTDICYGLLTGYACCTSNMHQGWPKFTQNLWYATPDNGLAALVYAPNEVKARVANNIEAVLKEETNYPFDETVKFTLGLNKIKTATFPLYLRIPAWCTRASLKVNGQIVSSPEGNQIVNLNRQWKNGDVIELQLPMHITKSKWYENSASVERGPLVYALKIGTQVKEVKNTKDPLTYGDAYNEIYPTTPWNYGFIEKLIRKPEESFTVKKSGSVSSYPWTAEGAPVILQTKAKRIPSWQLYNGVAGPVPYSIVPTIQTSAEEEITLIPYGCTQLRISQFPIVP
ncbi:glycoside hydrolase family 127 protein [Mucilaginibacter koreensis]